MQIGACPPGQVMVHFSHGGGPSTVQDDGLVISHAGVAVADGVAPCATAASLFERSFALLFSLPTADIGNSVRVINNKIVTAINLSFIKLFCRFQTSATPSLRKRHQTLVSNREIFPAGKADARPQSNSREYHNATGRTTDAPSWSREPQVWKNNGYVTK
jgi:hypothetical protein